MSDIVKRLRWSYPGTEPMPLMVEAADEIERLHAALQEIVITDPPAISADWFAEWKNLVFHLKGIARRAISARPQPTINQK